MKPEAISPSTARASRKRPAVASADPGPLEAKLSATRKGSFLPSVDPAVPPHTLLLGTQPSDNSLAHGQYFMTNANAFWHIVGGPAWSKCPYSQQPMQHPPATPEVCLLAQGYPLASKRRAAHPLLDHSGDALGFRRGFHIGGRSDAPDFVRRHLMHHEEVTYDEARRWRL